MRTLTAALALAAIVSGCSSPAEIAVTGNHESTVVDLPPARLVGSVSVEEALLERRSVRQYSDDPLSLEDVSQLLWAAQGVTADWGGRTAPSAGALYPLEVYLVAVRVDGLGSGVYRYLPSEHRLHVVRTGDVVQEVAESALDQSSVREAAAMLVFTAVYERTAARYGERAVRYVHMEVGHAAQNVCLQCTALGYGSVVIGSFDDNALRRTLNAPEDEAPLYVIPVGKLETDSS
jgi:SagB-type dehydrogenase family enzyme